MFSPTPQIKKSALSMQLIHVKRNFQITLPQQLRNALKIKEGDLMEAEISGNIIILKPKAVIDKVELESQKQVS